jgi:hypothetical protein
MPTDEADAGSNHTPELPKHSLKDEKNDKDHTCCCRWEDCEELRASIESSDDESLQLWKGDLIQINSGESASSRSLVASICRFLGAPVGLSRYRVAHHHFP